MFGVGDTLQCLEMGAVETLIVWENLEVGPLPHDCARCRTQQPMMPSPGKQIPG